MATYPQLATGAITHYPALRGRQLRTVVNTAGDGREVKLADAGAGITEWELSYSGLSDSERVLLEDFFRQMEGRLRSFAFLDPTGNLLTWSENLGDATWEKGPLLAVETGIADPWGGVRASRLQNTCATAQSLRQSIAVQADYVYCLSVYARAAAETTITLVCGTGRKDCRVNTAWTRLAAAGSGTGTLSTVWFGVETPPGAVEVFGMQAEAQPAPSGYQRTEARGGVYTVRFKDDALRFTTEDADRHSCRVKIIHADHL